MILGIPLGSVMAPIFGLVAVILCLTQIVRLWRLKDPLWIIGAAGVAYVPVVLYFWPRSDYLHPRYLFAVVPVLMLLVGLELGRWLASANLRVFAGALLIGFVASNAVGIAKFLRLGRGQYLQAVAFMAANTRGPEMIVDSPEHPRTTLMVVQYYDDYSLHGIRHLMSHGRPGTVPQWLVVDQDADPDLILSLLPKYRPVAVFPKGSVTSGDAWTIYESRDNSQTAPALQ